MKAEDIQNAFRLGDEHIDALIPYGHLARDIRYLLHQCEAAAVEVDDAGADWIPDAKSLMDYWDMAQRLGRDIEDPSVRYPQDLLAAHDRLPELIKQRELESMANLFRIRRKVLRKYSFVSDGLMIRSAASQQELTYEGDSLHHCVSTYGKRHAQGATAIFFIRRTSRPREPYYTLELDEKNLTVRQNRGLRNCARTPDVQAFEDKWLAWLRAGSKRDKDGNPVLPGKRKEAAA